MTSTSQSLCWLVGYNVDFSDNFVVICMALTGQEHVFKIYFLTNEWVTSQLKDLTNQRKDLTRRHN